MKIKHLQSPKLQICFQGLQSVQHPITTLSFYLYQDDLKKQYKLDLFIQVQA